MTRDLQGLGQARAEVTLWGVLVTYHRPEALAEMLKRLQRQSRPIDRLIVVDNGSESAVEEAALAAGALYIDARENLGPAGGIALGMERVLEEALDSDWITLLDDDDPPRTDDVLEKLLAFAKRCRARDPSTAGVGLAGARYDSLSGVFKRVDDEELVGAVPIDYIGGNQLPTYSCQVVRRVGVFEPSLFFGFEEGEYGLRLRSHGYKLYVDGEILRGERAYYGRLNLRSRALRTRDQIPAWRRYYSVRNATVLARRYAGALAPLVLAAGGGVLGALDLARMRRPMREVILPIRAGLDGLLGRSGRTVYPGSPQGSRQEPLRYRP